MRRLDTHRLLRSQGQDTQSALRLEFTNEAQIKKAVVQHDDVPSVTEPASWDTRGCGIQAELVRIPLADTSLYHVPANTDEDALVHAERHPADRLRVRRPGTLP